MRRRALRSVKGEGYPPFFGQKLFPPSSAGGYNVTVQSTSVRRKKNYMTLKKNQEV